MLLPETGVIGTQKLISEGSWPGYEESSCGRRFACPALQPPAGGILPSSKHLHAVAFVGNGCVGEGLQGVDIQDIISVPLEHGATKQTLVHPLHPRAPTCTHMHPHAPTHTHTHRHLSRCTLAIEVRKWSTACAASCVWL